MDVLQGICAAFSLGTPTKEPVSVAGGLTHRVLRVETDRGTYAVKVLNIDARGPWQAHWIERAFTLERSAFEGGLPLPRPVPVTEGDGCLAVIKDEEGRTLTVRVHEWLDGEALRGVVYGAEFSGRAGQVLAGIHALNMTADQALPETLRVRGRDHWFGLAERVEQSGIDWRWEFRGLLHTVLQLEAYVAAGSDDLTPLLLSHRDADQKNWMKSREGALFLVDWDAAGPIHPRHDVANTALAWAGVHLGEPDWKAVGAFIAAYRHAGGMLDRILMGDLAEFVVVALGWFEYNVRRELGDFGEDDVLRAREIGVARRSFKNLPRILRSIERWERTLGAE